MTNTTVWNLHQSWNYILQIKITYTFFSCIFLPGPLHRDSYKPVQVSKHFFKGLTRVGSTLSSYTMDIDYIFKNNVTMDNVHNISKKNCFAKEFCLQWTLYLGIPEYSWCSGFNSEYFEIFCKFGEIKYKIQQQLLTYLQSP